MATGSADRSRCMDVREIRNDRPSPAPSEVSVEYGGGAEAPERVVINITVQARPV